MLLRFFKKENFSILDDKPNGIVVRKCSTFCHTYMWILSEVSKFKS